MPEVVIVQSKQGLSKSQKKRLRQKRAMASSQNNNSTQAILNRNVSSMMVDTVGAANLRSQSQSRGRNRKARNNNRNMNGMEEATSAAYYAKSLMYPSQYPGAKVPDMISFPSGTFQLSAEGTLATGATAGDSVGITVTPYIGTPVLYPINTYNSVSAGSIGTITGVDWASKATIQAAFEQVRPVSAELLVEFIGPSTSDGGQITGALCARGNPISGTFASALSKTNSLTIPLKNGMRVTWRPNDLEDLSYFVPNIGGPQGTSLPFMQVVATGLPVSTSYLRYRVVVNYEGIPTNDTLNIVQVSASPSDPIALSKAFNFLGNNPLATVSAFDPRVAAQPYSRDFSTLSQRAQFLGVSAAAVGALRRLRNGGGGFLG